MRKRLTWMISTLALLISAAPASLYQVYWSPNHILGLKIAQTTSGQLTYSLWKNNKGIADTIIGASTLGFEFKNLPEYRADLPITSIKNSTVKSTLNLVWGEDKTLPILQNQITVKQGNQTLSTETQFVLDDDGLAFKQNIHSLKTDSIFVKEEKSSFNLKNGKEAWWAWADYDTQEQLFQHTEFSKATWINTPFTFNTQSGNWISIHEAALMDYPMATLKRDSTGIFKTDLVPWAEGTKVKASSNLSTPWRVVLVGKSPADLVNNRLINKLNKPADKRDWSWVKPIKYAGIWWMMHLGTHTWTAGEKHGATTQNALKYIDFAAANGVEGILIEGWNTGWDKWGADKCFDQITASSDFDLKKVAEYARSKGIQLIAHHETGGDAPWYENTMDSAFALCKRLGIKYVKTGYAGAARPKGEHLFGQSMVRHWQLVTETAAKYGILLDVHECIKPTGLCVTWPNMMTGEGVRGMEWEAWSDGNSTTHTTTLPFTRGLAGPMDYTPGIFDLLYKNRKSYTRWNGQEKSDMKCRVHSTLSHQMALWITLYSPWIMAADCIENYENQAAFEFFKYLKADFKKSVCLDGYPGKFCVTARQSEDGTWFIAGTANEEGAVAYIDFNFLGTGTWEGVLWRDTRETNWQTNPTEIKKEGVIYHSTERTAIRMAAGGGFVMRLKAIH